LVLAGYELARRLLLGWIPWSFFFWVYRVLRRSPRLFFSMQAVIMGELAGSRK